MRWSLPALAGALVVAAAGCGDDGLTRAETAERASAICASYAVQARELGAPDLADLEQAQTYFTRAEELAAEQQAELEALDPAADAETDHAELTAATAKAVALLGDLARAAADRDRERGTELTQQLAPLTAEVDAAADALGADDCSS